MAFLTDQSGWRAYSNGGDLEQGFWHCFAGGLNQSLVLSVARASARQ